ncbi:hypothetical protein N8289_00270 [Flavobacteriales bacterium]|jgi:DNA-binding transcriptional regulator YiaG|nr:hypothetical protein [Flavobacteriales bacterium]MDC1370254.1 hypothetical protein [Flavobacteriales bacterium]
MSQDNYLSLQTLVKDLNKKITKLEKGKLSLTDLNEALEHSRDVYERLTIIRYKALLEKQEIVQEIKEEIASEKEQSPAEIKEIIEEKVEESSFAFNFDLTEEETLDISPNQRNLLDEIQEVGGESVNEKYAEGTQPESVAEKMTNTKIEDLRKAIALNQKFLFMKDLFSGEKSAYDEAIDKLNSCHTIQEAKSFLASEVENKYNWEQETPAVEQFNNLLERKFL